MGLQYPFILQCKHCKTVIADSFALTNYNHGTLTLTHVSPFTRTRMSASSTLVLCECDAVIGRQVEGMYMLDGKEMVSYVLGNGSADALGMDDIVEEIGKLQKFCVYLYNRINDR